VRFWFISKSGFGILVIFGEREKEASLGTALGPSQVLGWWVGSLSISLASRCLCFLFHLSLCANARRCRIQPGRFVTCGHGAQQKASPCIILQCACFKPCILYGGRRRQATSQSRRLAWTSIPIAGTRKKIKIRVIHKAGSTAQAQKETFREARSLPISDSAIPSRPDSMRI